MSHRDAGPTLAFRVSDVARPTCITSVLHACTRLHPDAVRSSWLSLMSLTLSGEWWRGVCVCASGARAGFGDFVTIVGKDKKLSAEMEGSLGFWLWDPRLT
jgi:hypothetical protein